MEKPHAQASDEEAAIISPGSFRTAEVLVHGERTFHTVPVTGVCRQDPPISVRQRWQHSMDVLIADLGATIGLVTQIVEGGLSVLLTSGEIIAPYFPGTQFPFGSGSYCEEAIGQNRFISIDTTAWTEIAPGVGSGAFRRYCGLPLHWEDGSFSGTLCLLSRNDSLTESSARPMMEEFAASMEKDLELLTLRKQHDAADEKYARAMEAVLQYAPGGIFCYSAEKDDQFSYLSGNMLRFLGYTQQEFVEKFSNQFANMVYAEDRERVLREIDEQIRHGSFDRCEDHPLNQEIAKTLLESKGVLVDVAENGEVGVTHFSRSAVFYYDAILMDIRMPVLDGCEATRKIRGFSRPDAKKIPIIAMTADAFAEDVKRFLDAGMNAHIAKPIDPDKMYTVLIGALSSKTGGS